MSKMMVVCIFFLISPIIFSAEKNKSCEIHIKYSHKTGAESDKIFRLFAKTKSDCEKKSKLYKENLTSNQVNEKSVSVKWLGK